MMYRNVVRWAAAIIDPVDDGRRDVHLESGVGNWEFMLMAALLVGVAAILLSAFARQRRDRRNGQATGRILINVVNAGLMAVLAAGVLLAVYLGI